MSTGLHPNEYIQLGGGNEPGILEGLGWRNRYKGHLNVEKIVQGEYVE